MKTGESEYKKTAHDSGNRSAVCGDAVHLSKKASQWISGGAPGGDADRAADRNGTGDTDGGDSDHRSGRRPTGAGSDLLGQL